MGILGVGTDIISVARVRRLLKRYPVRLPEKILHPQEQADYSGVADKPAFLAKRFAAKEAVVKALGSGFTQGLYASEIIIYNDTNGCPQVRLSCHLGKQSREILVSIADEHEYAIAYAVTLNNEV